MVRTCRAALFALSLIFFPAGPATVSAAVVSVQPSQAQVAEGGTALLEIHIEGVADLYGYQFDVGFDPTVLSANGITEGDFLATGGNTFFVPGTIDNTAGVISFTGNTLLTAIGGVSGNGLLAVLSLSGLDEGISEVNLFGVTLLDSSLSGIDVTVESGEVQVAVPEIPEPSMFVPMAAAMFLLAIPVGRRARLSRLGARQAEA